MLWLKFLHIAAVTIWMAGLLYLPSMLWAHHRVRDQQDFARIRLASRFAYMGVASPAACIAIGAGAALLFFGDALHPWMFVKLAAVGGLVFAHVQYGYVLMHLADQEAHAPTLRVRIIALSVIFFVALALGLVLAKPQITADRLPGWMLEPGILPPREGQAPARPSPAPPHR